MCTLRFRMYGIRGHNYLSNIIEYLNGITLVFDVLESMSMIRWGFGNNRNMGPIGLDEN